MDYNNISVEELVNQLNLKDIDLVIKFGLFLGSSISYSINNFIETINSLPEGDLEVIINRLDSVMKEFDVKDFSEKKHNFIYKLINTGISPQEQLYKKYSQIEAEINKIYVRLKQYNLELESLNSKLNKIYEEFMLYLKESEIYVKAGEIAIDKWKAEKIFIYTDDGKMTFEILEQRVYDLKTTKNTTREVIRQIKAIEIMNENLINKIDSLLLDNIPMFKKSLKDILSSMKESQDELIEARALECLRINILNGIKELNEINGAIKNMVKDKESP